MYGAAGQYLYLEHNSEGRSPRPNRNSRMLENHVRYSKPVHYPAVVLRSCQFRPCRGFAAPIHGFDVNHHIILTKIYTVHMDIEDYIVTNVLDSIDYPDEHKGDIRAIYDKVYKLFVNASANCNLDNFFLTRDAVNYCRAFNIPNTALIHAAKADYQTNNLWASIYNKTTNKAGLTDEERTFLHCLRYMLTVESIYSQIVNKVCYLLVWQTKPPGMILGANKHCCKHIDTVDTISTRCSLATKCEFLAGNGFGDLADSCDRDLRNAVAHMTAVIGKPTVKRELYDTGTTSGSKAKFSIEGADIRIRRYVMSGPNKWENVDMNETHDRLNMAMWRYNEAFYLCNVVHMHVTSPTFLRAFNNPGDPHYKITFSNGGVCVSCSESGEANK